MEESPAAAGEAAVELNVDLDVEVVAGTLHLTGQPEQLAALGADAAALLPALATAKGGGELLSQLPWSPWLLLLMMAGLTPTGSPRLGGAAAAAAAADARPVRALSVVMLVTGTRGDAQPFIALGLRLQAYGHRVRLATHEAYRAFVLSSGLEFYPLGGDPAVLSEFVVSNRGIVPKHLSGAVGSTREMRAVVFSCLPACTAPDPGPPGGGAAPGAAFTADAIIANPPCYGHIHVAEKLGVPLHMAFTMPWTPTAAFPSPLTNAARTPSGALNRLSYRVVDDFVNLGLGSVINDFRVQALGLPPLVTGDGGSSVVQRCAVPFAYCFSPALVPKPADWPAWVDVVGYWTLPAATSQADFTPPPALEAFLAAGPPPVYVGFGSLVVDDPAGLTAMIVAAAAAAGVRVLIAKVGGRAAGLGGRVWSGGGLRAHPFESAHHLARPRQQKQKGNKKHPGSHGERL